MKNLPVDNSWSTQSDLCPHLLANPLLTWPTVSWFGAVVAAAFAAFQSHWLRNCGHRQLRQLVKTCSLDIVEIGRHFLLVGIEVLCWIAVAEKYCLDRPCSTAVAAPWIGEESYCCFAMWRVAFQVIVAVVAWNLRPSFAAVDGTNREEACPCPSWFVAALYNLPAYPRCPHWHNRSCGKDDGFVELEYVKLFGFLKIEKL